MCLFKYKSHMSDSTVPVLQFRLVKQNFEIDALLEVHDSMMGGVDILRARNEMVTSN